MTQNNTTQSGQCEALRAALAAQRNLWKEHNFPAYIELDVHKETVVVSVARCGRQDPEQWAEIPNTPPSMRKLVGRLNEEFHGQVVLFCYEAGSCSFGSLDIIALLLLPASYPKRRERG